MAATFTIPLITLQPGSRTFGPAHPADTDTLVTMAIDRTVAGGLNSLTSASWLDVDVQMSNDGGNTWHGVDTNQPGSSSGWGTPGGLTTYTDFRDGLTKTINLSAGTWPIGSGTSRLIRCTAIVTGGVPIAVAGSIATQ